MSAAINSITLLNNAFFMISKSKICLGGILRKVCSPGVKKRSSPDDVWLLFMNSVCVFMFAFCWFFFFPVNVYYIFSALFFFLKFSVAIFNKKAPYS